MSLDRRRKIPGSPTGPPESDKSRSIKRMPENMLQGVLSQFSLSDSYMNACNSILEAACSSIQFDFVEIWSYCVMEPPQPVERERGGRTTWKPYCVHMYSVPHTINDAIVSEEEGQRCDNQRHLTSPQLVDKVKSTSEPCWLTAGSSPFDNLYPPAATQNPPPFQTVVTLPFKKENYHGPSRTGDVALVLYAFGSHCRNESTLKFLEHIGIAAVILISPSFQIEKRDKCIMPELGRTALRNSVGVSTQSSHNHDPFGSFELIDLPDERDIDLDMKFELLQNVGFFESGSGYTMYEGYTKEFTETMIKMVSKDADKELMISQLLVEINILRLVKHPNIVNIIGAGFTAELFMCVERLNGGTLAERCGSSVCHNTNRQRRFINTISRAGDPFTTKELLQCMNQIASAMKYLHTEAIPEITILHRDLKPDNIAFDFQGNVKLIDFGLSRIVTKKSVSNSTYVMTGLVGSLRYMAPEVALRLPYDHKVDVYSYGLIVWQMASMMPPYKDFSRKDIFDKVIHGRYRPNIYENWPETFKNLIKGCWAHDADMRPDFTGIVEEIANITERLSNQAMPQPPFEHVSRYTHCRPQPPDVTHSKSKLHSPIALDA